MEHRGCRRSLLGEALCVALQGTRPNGGNAAGVLEVTCEVSQASSQTVPLDAGLEDSSLAASVASIIDMLLDTKREVLYLRQVLEKLLDKEKDAEAAVEVEAVAELAACQPPEIYEPGVVSEVVVDETTESKEGEEEEEEEGEEVRASWKTLSASLQNAQKAAAAAAGSPEEQQAVDAMHEANGRCIAYLDAQHPGWRNKRSSEDDQEEGAKSEVISISSGDADEPEDATEGAKENPEHQEGAEVTASRTVPRLVAFFGGNRT